MSTINGLLSETCYDAGMKPVRINKYLSEHGIASRREADRLVESGSVLVNGEVPELGALVSDKDEIEVEGKRVTMRPESFYIVFHKPVGLITTMDTSKPDNVIGYLDFEERVFPVGRLDVASSGLLLMTNDGEFSHKLMHPKFEHEKEYEVEVNKPITDEDIAKLEKGIKIRGGKTKTATVHRVNARTFGIILKEGKNRQIRSMCEKLGYDVKSLVRIRIKSVWLGKLRVGGWRHLTNNERDSLLS